MPDDRTPLKLGKGVFFVKSQLRRLDQEADAWEADFFPLPRSADGQDSVWLGLVLSHAHEHVLAHVIVREPPNVNDLADLLAEAMRRPLVEFAHRPRDLFLRSRPEWAELLPHLQQVGILVQCWDALAKWDAAFGNLYPRVDQILGGRDTERGRPPSKSTTPVTGRLRTPAGSPEAGKVRVYTLDVFLPRRRVGRTFLKTKSGVSRLIQIRGDQTLEDLHNAIFAAFDREDEHLYEFQLGRGPQDRQGPTYGPDRIGDDQGGAAGETTLDSLGLRVGRSFGYLFDFGDNWWHQINVAATAEAVPTGVFPRVIKRVGSSPPQYPDDEDDE